MRHPDIGQQNVGADFIHCQQRLHSTGDSSYWVDSDSVPVDMAA